ncbi:filamentation induced by cAMP protein Fic, partial [Haematobacter missouriensis]
RLRSRCSAANPYCRISNLVDSGVAKRQTAAAHLKAMVSEGLLEEVRVGRENLYINPTLLALLSERGQTNI